MLAPMSLLVLSGCSSADEPLSPSSQPGDDNGEMAEGQCAVTLAIRGNYGAPLSSLSSTSRSSENYPRDLAAYTPEDLPEGSTLWVAYTDETDADDKPDFTQAPVHSYVVGERIGESNVLYPCDVDTAGVCTYKSNRPLYLNQGETYYFRAMGPARALTANNGLYITNGQAVYCNDNRWDATADTQFTVSTTTQTEVCELNPMINQTAQIKLTIECEKIAVTDSDGNQEYDENGDPLYYYPIHDMAVTSSGVIITGLQNNYSQLNAVGEPFNWLFSESHLFTYPGDVTYHMKLDENYMLASTDGHKMTFEAPILPCDAVATPIIVEFYMRINGVPTQFEMMLNRKMFLGAYSYHYKGTLSIEEGIYALEWLQISSNVDISDPPTIISATPNP